MNQLATASQLRQANRNQQFQNIPMTSGQCGLMQKEVAIFPVRYALDESPQKGSLEGPNPLPKTWSGSALPPLTTRSYCLRQLRDGWLYVLDSVDQTFHEYQVQGEMLIRHTWTQSQLNQDTRNNPGQAQPYLLYPRFNQLRLAYSPVQWTWRLCELMRSSTGEHSRWMRSVNLPAYCTSGTHADGAPIVELGESVADIMLQGGTAPTFASTLLPTIATDVQAPFKPGFEEALVRGRVPAQDTALFVALDDPLAMVDDLNMNLVGRLLEQSRFEAQHQHTLESAAAVVRLCGFDTEAFIPPSLKDPIQIQAYTNDLYALLSVHDEIQRAKELSGDSNWLVDIGPGSIRSAAEQSFTAKWGPLPEKSKWQAARDEWDTKRLWREDVRFDEAQHYLTQTTLEALQLHAHIQRSEADLIIWLDQLAPNAEAVYHDTVNEQQASQLLETAHALYTALGNAEGGQQWLSEQAKAPTQLFGLALFNFNPELAALIKTVSHNFSKHGTLDDQGREGDGSTAPFNPAASGDATSVATRSGEIKAVFDLEVVKNSRAYQAMSRTAQQTMATLIQVANHQAWEAWHGLSGFLLPAMKQQMGMTFAALQVLISTEISSHTQMTFNPTYRRDFQAWLFDVKALQNKISGEQRVLSRPGFAHDQRAARLSLRAFEEQMQMLFFRRPNEIIAKVAGSTRITAGIPQINRWLADLGQSEVMAQLQLKSAASLDYLHRTKAWMGQNLGSALPSLLVGLNAWNFFSSAQQAQNDGKFTADEWRTVSANAAYTGNALAALWVGPAWSRAGGMAAQLGKRTLSIAQAGYTEWLAASRVTNNVNVAIAGEFAQLSKRLIWRTVTWAALGAVAAGLEAWQTFKDSGHATSLEEKILLRAKLIVLVGMFATPGLQAIGAGLGHWFSFAWIMSPPVTILLMALGVAYLLISTVANRYKREGLRLWLHRCNWGRGTLPEWKGNDGHVEQMQALLETLQRPSVMGRTLRVGGGSTPEKWSGFWVHIQVPKALAGQDLILQPALIEKNYFSDDQLLNIQGKFYDRLLNGNWVDPKQLGQLPGAPASNTNPADFAYSDSDQHRLWQVWIESSQARPILELEVTYPPGVLQRSDGRGYMFRVALEHSTHEADRSNNAFSGELKDDIVLAKQSTTRLKLAVPNELKTS